MINKYKVKGTTLSEIKACIGLLYMAGVFKSSRQNLGDLWANDQTGMEIFSFTMNLQRFRFLLQYLRSMTEQLGQQDLKWTN
jgi:hypothetical protein